MAITRSVSGQPTLSERRQTTRIADGVPSHNVHANAGYRIDHKDSGRYFKPLTLKGTSSLTRSHKCQTASRVQDSADCRNRSPSDRPCLPLAATAVLPGTLFSTVSRPLGFADKKTELEDQRRRLEEQLSRLQTLLQQHQVREPAGPEPESSAEEIQLPDTKLEKMIYAHMFPVGDKRDVLEKEHRIKQISPDELSEDDLDKYVGKEGSFNMASLKNHVLMQSIVRGYRRRGYLLADFDPLYSVIKEKGYTDEKPPPLILRQHSFPEKEKNKFILPDNTFLCADRVLTLPQLTKHLHRAYCGNIGFEYMDDYKFAPKSYLRMNIEWPEREYMTVEEHVTAAQKLLRAQALDDLVLAKYPDFWQYSMRGCETGVLITDFVVRKGAAAGFDSFVIGMPEFGRLAFLMNAMDRSPKELLATMVSKKAHLWANWYTLGATHSFANTFNGHQRGNMATLLLVQQIDGGDSYFPVTLGRTKAMQTYEFDINGSRSMAIIVHKPRSVECAATTFETIKLLTLPGYQVQGAIHIVINNQVGHTREIMSEVGSTLCTDVFKVIRIPILHVNSTHIEAVMFCVNLAVDYKRRFNMDIVIDVVGFSVPPKAGKVGQDTWIRRRMVDQRAFLHKYKLELDNRKIMDTEQWESLEVEYKKEMETAYEEAVNMEGPDPQLWTQCLSPWLFQEFQQKNTNTDPETGVEVATLAEMANVVTHWPPNFNIRDEDKVELLEKGLQYKEDKLDYDLCEMLAVGSLMKERTHVRIVGMHVHERNYVLWAKDDVNTKENLLGSHFRDIVTCTANHLVAHRQQNAALGFEFGFSFCDKKQLLIYEFPRNADLIISCQPILFTYLAAPSQAYAKSPIVIVVPHCQGCFREYDSADGWPRKIMMLTDESEEPSSVTKPLDQRLRECNFYVASVSSPAQYFHFLRRQMHLPYIRPLVLYVSDCDTDIVDNFSSINDIKSGTKAQLMIEDKMTFGEDVEKLIFCTGHVYNFLKEERNERNLVGKVAVVSIEQWHPFPYQEFSRALERRPRAELAYAQVEQVQSGWWHAVKRKVALVAPHRNMSLHLLYLSQQGTLHCRSKMEILLDDLFRIKSK
ncbi:hypothetical protein AAG570_010050 [Ranatra chinensis]|uniref:Transketolase-like pyrimidine-binding domain-containing protein n=1 Tax=Ranatra chinensis TaxID=642074 RepID=A0ABD0YLJ5_9HEMI